MSPLAFGRARFVYDPYPIGVIKDVFCSEDYRALVASFPPVEAFRFMKHHGEKYSLSEVNHPDRYRAFIRDTPAWRKLHAYLKSPRFIPDVAAMLKDNGIDLGIHAAGPDESGAKALIRRFLDRAPPVDRLTSRFEFSMMPALAGSIRPHTDSPQKIITLVVSMLGEEGWREEYGGATEVMKPRDISRNYNQLNAYLDFDEVETVDAMPYEPNQCVVFVKTFNSLHGVRPMNGPQGLLRRTLTINIETPAARSLAC